MKNLYIKIEGMTCDHCRIKIQQELEKQEEIVSVTFDGIIAQIRYHGSLDKNNLIQVIRMLGYETSFKNISSSSKKIVRQTIYGLIKIVAFLCFIWLVLERLLGINIITVIPVVNSKTTFGMLFLIGLFTSIHCISMCGAINLLASTSNTKKIKKPLIYNLGRLTSYTFLGGIVGFVGSVFQLNQNIQGIILIISATVLFLMGINRVGIRLFSIPRKQKKRFYKKGINNSYLLGILNGLMPCGPLQAMQLYALSTGSFLFGALSMFLFCLGTIPLMLFFGSFANYLTRNVQLRINQFSTALILILSFTMLQRGFLTLGIDVTSYFQSNKDHYLKSTLSEKFQTIEFNLSYSGYKDIVVERGKKVKLVIQASKETLTGCNNSIRIPEYGISSDLQVGKTVIEFFPDKTGTYFYTCWMSMLKNKIVVVDKIKEVSS